MWNPSEVKKARCFYRPVLPISYDDSLSYLEQICQLVYKVNELLDLYNDIPDFVKDEIAKSISEFEAKLNEFEGLILQEFANYKIETNAALNDIRKWVVEQNDATLGEVDKRFSEISGELDEKLKQVIFDVEIIVTELDKTVKTYLVNIENEISDLRNQIAELKLKAFPIYNPTTDKIDSIENTVKNVYDADRESAYTATEYDAFGLEAKDFDALGTDATYLDFEGGALVVGGIDFYHLIPKLSMYSPFTGVVEKIWKILDFAITRTLKGNAYLATEYDALELEATDYDALEVTAYEFDFEGKTYIAG